MYLVFGGHRIYEAYTTYIIRGTARHPVSYLFRHGQLKKLNCAKRKVSFHYLII